MFVSYPGGYWELSPSPWQEQPVFLTVSHTLRHNLSPNLKLTALGSWPASSQNPPEFTPSTGAIGTYDTCFVFTWIQEFELRSSDFESTHSYLLSHLPSSCTFHFEAIVDSHATEQGEPMRP